MVNHPQERIALRLKSLRAERGLTQEDLAEAMGLGHRQTISSIEAGERSVTAEELAAAAAALGVEIEVFTDPFRLVGEGRFSFRADDVPAEVLNEFEERAGRWVATYRTLLERSGVPRPRLGRKLELTRTSSFEDAHAAAEEIRTEWRLGDVPAETLPEAVHRELDAKVLFVDAPAGISGAAIHLPGRHVILVNRHEPAGRRNFDLAHELFHLLTWDAMTPARVEPREVSPRKGNRVEKLAENFAGALLMPADVLTQRWREKGTAVDVHDWLNATATSLGVTSSALRWRMVVLGHLSKPGARSLDSARLANNGGLTEPPPPPSFNHDFVARVYHAVEAGQLSLRKATRILGMTTGEFSGLCGTYGLELSYEA